MKCKQCGNSMKTRLGDTVIHMDGTDIQVNNIPIFACSNCENKFIHDVVLERAQNYARQFGTQNNQLDFGLCEEKEGEEATLTMQTLGIL